MEVVQPSCLLCLEPTQEPKPPVLPCRCVFQAHQECWQKWETTKGRPECPLCHMAVVTNPLVLVLVPATETDIVTTIRLIVSCGQIMYCLTITGLIAILLWVTTYKGE